MVYFEVVKIAFVSLWSHKLRSFLTLIGITFGVMTVAAVAAVIEGFFHYVDRTMAEELGTNTVVLDKFGIITSFEDYLDASRRNKDLTQDDLTYLRERLTLAEHIGAQTDGGADLRSEQEYLPGVKVRGMSASMMNIGTIQPEYGRVISESDDIGRRYFTMIGSKVADELFNRRDVVGQMMKIDGLPFEIIGVAKEQGSFFGQSRDEFVIVPLEVYQKMWGTHESLIISIKAFAGVDLQDLQDQIRMLMRVRHRLNYDDRDTFKLVTADTINSFVFELFGIIAAVALGITSITLIVGGIVIMNIMLVTVTERTREIGIRKSLGARHRDIMLQFLVESMMLSLTGGLIGLALAYAVSQLLVSFTSISVELPFWAAVLAVAMSSGVGLAFGLYPAWKAARLDAIVALRTE
jgi:putative ABC transport system permease protein